MQIDTDVNIETLLPQLQAAGLAITALRYLTNEDGTPGGELRTDDDAGHMRDFTPEEQPVVLQVVAAHSPARTQDFEAAEDTDRLRLVRERAAEDPAFAALVELTLGKQGV